ncbi:hypothetical protein RV18_GL001366 [Enterococcus termitis]|nr:hypothetical protein RV18_GL001366 [Enterococcus termitis]
MQNLFFLNESELKKTFIHLKDKCYVVRKGIFMRQMMSKS